MGGRKGQKRREGRIEMFALIAQLLRSASPQLFSSGGIFSTMLNLANSNTHPLGSGYTYTSPLPTNSYHIGSYSNGLSDEAASITDRAHGPYHANLHNTYGT